jgi:hypothetical protein
MVSKSKITKVEELKISEKLRAAKEQVSQLQKAAVDAGYKPDHKVDPGDPFPLDLLPEGLRDYISESARASGVDPRMVALPVMVAAAAAIGTTRRIEVKRGWCEPGVLWGSVIAKSGSVKSAGIDQAKILLEPHEEQWRAEYREAMEKYDEDHAEYEKKFSAWRKNEDPFAKPPKEPEKPIERRLQIDDSTLESLAPLLQENPRGLLCLIDELKGWFDAMGIYSKGGAGGGRDQSRWLQLHGCRTWRYDRKTDRQRIAIPYASAWVCGTIQPLIMAAAMSDDRRSSGLLARILLVWPVPSPKAWTEDEVDPATEERAAAIITKLLSLKHGEALPTSAPKPIDLELSKPARQRAKAFVNRHGWESFDHGDTSEDLAAAWSKLEGYAFRFALIIHLVKWADGDQTCHHEGAIGADSLESGIELARWFAAETERVYAGLAITNDVTPGALTDHPSRLAEWLASREGEVTERVAGRGLARYRGDDGAKLLAEDLRVLQARGLVVKENTPKTCVIRITGGDSCDSDTSSQNAGENAKPSPEGGRSVTDAENPAATLADPLSDTSGEITGETTQPSLSQASPVEKPRRRRRLS